VGKTLTAKPGGWSPSGVSLTYQWYRDATPIARATGVRYKVQAADAGARLIVRVTGAKPGYTSTTTASRPTKKVPWLGRISAASPNLVGKPKVGATLKARLGKVRPSRTTSSYQWYRGTIPIAGATGARYLLTAVDKGQQIRVKVTFTKAGYPTLTRTSKKVRIG
jgi:hypothetical protein